MNPTDPHTTPPAGTLHAPGPAFALNAINPDPSQRLADTEWLLTTGTGGFAMGTALGTPRRRYHALFIPAATPPVERLVALTQLHEQLVIAPGTNEEQSHTLATYETASDSPTDDRAAKLNCPALARFEKDRTTARWIYRVGETEVVKELRLGFRTAQFAVRYTVLTRAAVLLVIRPLVALRDFHDLQQDAQPERWRVHAQGPECEVTAAIDQADPLEHPDDTEPRRPTQHTLRLRASGGQFETARHLLRRIRYRFETDRGAAPNREDHEDLFVPGTYTAEFEPDPKRQEFTIAGALAPASPNLDLFNHRAAQTYLEATIKKAREANPGLAGSASLVLAADDFLVERAHQGENFTTVIAGYPWFADWGRDAMIALPGLMLATGRLTEAKACLSVFARNVSRGMIPNRFDDYGGPPHYNTVDAPLWFLHAVWSYVNAARAQQWYFDHLHIWCWQIIEYYQTGTRFGIAMDPEDHLIAAGDHTTQLTWMDAKREDVVFTPRHGKAVEINALWHHALHCVADLCEHTEPDRAARYRDLAKKTRVGFLERFWHPERNALNDCVQKNDAGEWIPTTKIRPNQIFAASLPHSPLSKNQQKGVIEEVTRELLTPLGLRTLAPADPDYAPRFEGNMMTRDRAYHNGTVWPWLIGPYAEALLRFSDFSHPARAKARNLIQPLIDSLASGCLGQICEVYDADEPRRPQGCMAQAWSVAEVLRIAALAG